MEKMKGMKQKFIAGIVAGAVLTGIGISATSVKAAENAEDQKNPSQVQRGRIPHHPQVRMSADDAAKHVHETFGVDEEEVKAAITAGKDFRDIGQAAMLSKISEKPFKDVLAMKTEGKNWQEVAKELGVTRDQVEGQMRSMQAMHIGQRGNVDQDVALALLNDGYRSRDIECAGILAQAAGKDIQSVLAMKKINNKWSDVAAQLGVDQKILQPKDPRGIRGNGGPRGARLDGAMICAPDEAPQDAPENDEL